MYRVMVPIHSSNVQQKIMSSQCTTLAKSPACRMDIRETPATKAAEAAAPQREPTDICALASQRTFLTQEEMVLQQTGLCCLLLPKKSSHMWSICLCPKCFSTSQRSLQIKNRAQINIGIKFNRNLRRKMTQMVYLATRHGYKNNIMMLKKKVLIINTQ